MFQSPRHISRAVKESWPYLHLGIEFEVVRALGRLSVIGMGLFVLVVLCSGLIDRNRAAAGHDGGRDKNAA